MSGYVLVSRTEEDKNDSVELPTEDDGTLLLSVVQSQFEGASGIRYRHVMMHVEIMYACLVLFNSVYEIYTTPNHTTWWPSALLSILTLESTSSRNTHTISLLWVCTSIIYNMCMYVSVGTNQQVVGGQ